MLPVYKKCNLGTRQRVSAGVYGCQRKWGLDRGSGPTLPHAPETKIREFKTNSLKICGDEWREVADTNYLIPNTWTQVLGTKYLVPSTWYQVSGTEYLVPSIW